MEATHVDDVVEVFAVEALHGSVGGVDGEQVIISCHQRLRLTLTVLLLPLVYIRKIMQYITNQNLAVMTSHTFSTCLVSVLTRLFANADLDCSWRDFWSFAWFNLLSACSDSPWYWWYVFIA